MAFSVRRLLTLRLTYATTPPPLPSSLPLRRLCLHLYIDPRFPLITFGLLVFERSVSFFFFPFPLFLSHQSRLSKKLRGRVGWAGGFINTAIISCRSRLCEDSRSRRVRGRERNPVILATGPRRSDRHPPRLQPVQSFLRPPPHQCGNLCAVRPVMSDRS